MILCACGATVAFGECPRCRRWNDAVHLYRAPRVLSDADREACRAMVERLRARATV